jgi:hypothetical protein
MPGNPGRLGLHHQENIADAAEMFCVRGKIVGQTWMVTCRVQTTPSKKFE